MRRRAAGWFAAGIIAWIGASIFTGPAWWGIGGSPTVTGQTAVVLQTAALVVAAVCFVRGFIVIRRPR